MTGSDRARAPPAHVRRVADAVALGTPRPERHERKGYRADAVPQEHERDDDDAFTAHQGVGCVAAARGGTQRQATPTSERRSRCRSRTGTSQSCGRHRLPYLAHVCQLVPGRTRASRSGWRCLRPYLRQGSIGVPSDPPPPVERKRSALHRATGSTRSRMSTLFSRTALWPDRGLGLTSVLSSAPYAHMHGLRVLLPPRLW